MSDALKSNAALMKLYLGREHKESNTKMTPTTIHPFQFPFNQQRTKLEIQEQHQ